MNILRRSFLLATGLGGATWAVDPLLAAPNEQGVPHHNPTAKSVIFLFMAGGPSQVDTLDPKPDLAKLSGWLSAESSSDG